MSGLQLVILPIVVVMTLIVVGGAVFAIRGGRDQRRPARLEGFTEDGELEPHVLEQIARIRPMVVVLDAREAEELLDVMIGLKRRLGSCTSIRERRAIMQFNERVKETRR